MPKNTPRIVEVPAVNYIAVCAKGNPNAEDSRYKTASVCFTVQSLQ